MFNKSSRITVTVILSVFLLFIALLTGSCRNPASQRNIIVSFDTAGGTPIIECQIIHPGERIEPVADPTRAGFRFAGWYQDPPYYTTNWDFFDCFAWRNKTLYARWTRAGGGGGGAGGGGVTPPAGTGFSVTVNSVSTGLYDLLFTDAGPFTGPFTEPPNASTPTAAAAASITATPGQLVTITASRPDHDVNLPLNCTLEFGKWHVPNNNVTFTDSSMRTRKTASFIMPAENVVIEAVFVDGSIFSTVFDTLNFPIPRYTIENIPWWSVTQWPLDLIIPGSIRGNYIQALSMSAFQGHSLTSVSIPYGVTHIHNEVFTANDLTHVDIPDSVIHIGETAFAFNPMTSVTIGNGVQTIDEWAFFATSLTCVTFPASVNYIGISAFMNIPNLTGIIIYGTSVTIYDTTFAGSPSWAAWPCSFYANYGPIITLPGTFDGTTGNWVRLP